MKKNKIFCVVRLFFFYWILFFVNNVFCQNKELYVPKLHNLFPYIPRGFQNIENKKNRWTTFQVSKINPAIDNGNVNFFDFRTFVMIKLITAFNGDSAAKSFESCFFPLFLEKRFQCLSDADALDRAFRCKATSIPHGYSGATALVVVFSNDMVTVAHVGDNIAFLCKKNNVVRLTNKHTYDDDDELLRLCNCEYDLLNEKISVTRAFGFDEKYKWVLAPLPDIKEFSIGNDDTFLILATKEIECLSVDDIFVATESALTPEDVSDALMSAIKKSSGNDIKYLLDLKFIVVKLVRQSARVHRKNLNDFVNSMRQLVEFNKNETIDVDSFCLQYQQICKKVSLLLEKKNGSVLNYQTNDLFYLILRLGFENFCYAKKRFWRSFNKLKGTIDLYVQMLVYVWGHDHLIACFQKNQQKLIYDWLEATMLFLLDQHVFSDVYINNANIFFFSQK